MKSNRTMPERLMAMALCLVLFVGMMPSGISTVRAEETVNYGTVSQVDVPLDISGDGTANVTATNSEVITLDYVQDDGSRGADGWWIGVKVTAPETVTENAYFISGDTEKFFAESKDGEDYITMWKAVNIDHLNNDADGVVSYTWKFYWDGTEASEQIVKLSIDASKVILNNADGTRAYPSVYGTLSSTYGGTLSGDGTNNTVLTVSDVNVPYDTVAKEWHIDVTVTAPAHISEAKEGENIFTSPTTYNLVLTPDGDNYTVDGELSGTFYWDGVEQQMSIKAENVTLVKADQAALEFATTAPVDQYLTTGGINPKYGTYTNKATGGTVGEITYKSSNTELATVNNEGKVTFKNTGTVTITATRAGDAYYEAVEASYNLTIVNRIWGMAFTYSNPDDFVYGTDGNVFKNPATYGEDQISGVSYSSSDTQTATVNNDGKVQILKVGTVTITASKVGWGYRDESISYNLTIVQGNQNVEIAGEKEVLFNAGEDYNYTYVVSGIVSTGATTATSSNEAVATVELNADGNVVVSPVAAGNFTLTVSNEGDENYKASEATMEITILVEESEAKFEKSGIIKITYNDNGNVFTNALTDVLGNTEFISYSSSDPKVATVDNSGKVTILKAGEITITANKAADEVYGAVSCSYKLKINKADQVIAFAETTPYVKVGTSSYQQIATESGELYGTGKITYSVVKADLDYKKNTFNTETGAFELKSNKIGTITIRATKAADDCYNETTATYTLTVTHEQMPSPAYTLSEATGNNGWYTGEVTIYPVTGYKISYSFEYSNSRNWIESLTYDKEGKNSPVIYLLNNATKGVTPAVTIEELKIDTKCPTNLRISYSNDVWGQVLEAVTFGFYDAQMTVTIHAEDETSGVAAIYYNYDGEWLSATPDRSGNISFTIDPEYRGKVQYYAVDDAGNKSEELTAKTTLIVDTVKPGINVSWSDAVNDGDDGRHYYDSEAVATVIITEANFFDGEGVKVNGGKFDGAWTAATDEEGNEIENAWANTITLREEGDHIVTISYSDRSRNEMDTYTSEVIVIDYTAPVITLERNLNGTCTNQTITTQITVVEHNFDASSVTVTLEGESPVMENHELSLVWSEAKTERGEVIPDTYVANVTISGDSIYTLNVEIVDPVNHSDRKEASFIVEMTAPTNLEIAYSDDVWGAVLEAVTFGYYNAPMTVTIHAEDATSGVATIHYNYNGEWKAAEPDANGEICFRIDPEYRGNVQYYAVDNAGNKSEALKSETTLVVDTIKPGINVSWSDAITVTNNTRYYDGKAMATVTITEANFFNGEDVVITGGTFDDEWKTATDEKGNEIEDVWVNTVTLETEGNHTLKIAYTDRSKNEMDTYTSETIVIDYTAPVISASINTGATRQYYNQTQIITISVNERLTIKSQVPTLG